MSTSNSASPLPRPRGAMSLRTPVEVSAWTTAITAGAGCADKQAVRVDGLAPGGVHPDDLGAVTARHLAHPLAEDAVDPDHHRITGPDEIDEGRLHARRTGPAHRQRQRVRGGEDLPQAVVGAVEQRQELRIEMAQHRSGQRHGDLRVRIRRPRPHEEAVGYPHRRIVTGPRSPAPTRRAARRVSGRLPAWIGCSTPLGRYRPCLPTSARIRAPTRRGCAGARSNGRGRHERPGQPTLCLVMVVGDDDPAAVGRTLESVGGQTSRRWSLTVVTPEGRLDEVRTLVRSAHGPAGPPALPGPRVLGGQLGP